MLSASKYGSFYSGSARASRGDAGTERETTSFGTRPANEQLLMRAARATATTGVRRHVIGPVEMAGILAGAGLWSTIAFVLNLTWEIAHVRLYTIWGAADGMSVALALLHCSLGDVVIALALFALAGIVLRRADWPASRPWVGGAIVMIGAVAFTAWSEWYNVYRAGNWGYTASMPMIFGIGLSPLLQWSFLPRAMVGAYRELGPALFGQQFSQSQIPTHDCAKGQR